MNIHTVTCNMCTTLTLLKSLDVRNKAIFAGVSHSTKDLCCSKVFRISDPLLEL